MAYCNIQTDLKDVCADIGSYVQNNVLDGWQLASGQASTYYITHVGYIEKVYDDGAILTSRSDIATTEANAGSYYYDSTNGILYVHAFGSHDLTSNNAPVIEEGVAYTTIATRAVNDASEEIDAYFNQKYPTPILERWKQYHVSAGYPAPLRKACSLLACRNIIFRHDPTSELGVAYQKMALNFDPEPGEEKGLIPKILEGLVVLDDQETALGEIGRFNVWPDSSNSGTGYIRLYGEYTGHKKMLWRLEIDAEGTPGTATYKLSYDGGTNWDHETQETFDFADDDRRIHLAFGIYCEFQGTFAAEDKWDIEVIPKTDRTTGERNKVIEMVR